jgi:hypothetical protein
MGKVMTENNLDEFVKRLLVICAEHDVTESISWNTSLEFFVKCNDFFFWACADAVDILPENLETFRQALQDAGLICGPLLFCARERKMRPQGASYKYLKQELWPLFNACGPEREIGMFNPLRPGQ